MPPDEQRRTTTEIPAAGLVTSSQTACTKILPAADIERHKATDADEDAGVGVGVDDDHFDFDSIFTELGEFGRYQTIVYGLMCVAVLMYGQVTLTYVFTAGDLNYRCAIPATDCAAQAQAQTQTTNISQNCADAFHPEWLADEVPISELTGMPAKCQRYATTDNVAVNSSSGESQRLIVGCDRFVYQTGENNLLRQFNLQCARNDWLRTIVGSANNAALFVGLPLIGCLSDRYGRKLLFIWGLVGCALLGLVKSMATSYPAFLALEMLDAFVGSGTFMGAYVLAMELVGPGHRTLSGVLVNCCYTVGVMLLGVWASTVEDYRVWLRICYAPALLVVGYQWCIPESTRWLFCVNRRTEGARNIRRVARVNGRTLSVQFERKLRRYCDREPTKAAGADGSGTMMGDRVQDGPFRQFFRSPALVARTLVCCWVWLIHAFVTYGLTLNSVDLAAGSATANKHTNFILMSGIEIPACICTYFLMDRLGRKASLGGFLLLAAATCGGLLVLPKLAVGASGQQVAFGLFILGKFAITASFSVLYVYTAEIVPTAMRAGLMSTCSMVGRVGSMLAAQTPLMERWWAGGPLMLYGCAAVATAVAVWVAFPETLGTRLPDTVEEAVNVGRRKGGGPRKSGVSAGNAAE